MILSAERKRLETQYSAGLTGYDELIAAAWLFFYLGIVAIGIASPTLTDSVAVAGLY